MRNSMLSFMAALLASAWVHSVSAQEAATPAQAPAEVQQLVELLRKPEVQEWLSQGRAGAGSASRGDPESVGDEARAVETNFARDFRLWVAATRSHVAGDP